MRTSIRRRATILAATSLISIAYGAHARAGDPAGPPRESIITLPLERADAVVVAPILCDMIERRAEALADLQGEVRVVADPASNAILAAVLPDDAGIVRRAVAALDVVRQGVLLEIVVAEFTIDDPGIAASWEAAVTTPGPLELTATPFEASLVPLVRTLQSEGKLEVLCAPKILVFEGELVEVALDRVPFVTGGRITSERLVLPPPRGPIIDITVGRLRDGRIPLTLDHGSSLPDLALGLTDGETAMVRGMRIQSETTTLRTSILGDIPLLGRLFGAEQTRTVTAELIVFVTARRVAPEEEGG